MISKKYSFLKQFFKKEEIFLIKGKSADINTLKAESSINQPEEGIMVVTSGHEDEYQELLENILKAIGSDLKDSTIYKPEELKGQDVMKKFELILSFGVYTIPGLTDNQVHKIHRDGKSKVIISHSLDQLDKNIDLKKQLWSILKKL